MAATELGVWHCTNQEYHDDVSAVGHSMLQVYRRSPVLYRERFITRVERPEATPQQIAGHAIHCLTLEPQEFGRLYAIAPECDRRTKDGKLVYADFVQQSAGKTVLTREQHLLAIRVAEAVRDSGAAMNYLGRDGDAELSLRWSGPWGVPCKCRCDYLTHDGFLIDLKTTSSDPAEFPKSVARYGYHRQAAHYLDGVTMVLGRRPQLRWIVACTEPPYDVWVWTWDDEREIAAAYAANVADLGHLHRAMESKQWTDERTEREHAMSLPAWAD